MFCMCLVLVNFLLIFAETWMHDTLTYRLCLSLSHCVTHTQHTLSLSVAQLKHLHCKKSVDFMEKYLASGCQFFYRYFYGRLSVEQI